MFPHYQVSEAVRRGTRVHRDCDGSEFTRLEASASKVERVELEAAFAKAADGVFVLSGTARAALALECHRCESDVAIDVTADFELCLVDEERAASLDASRDIRIVVRDRVNVVEIAEDELLLSLPARVCVDVQCTSAPALSYPAQEVRQKDLGQSEETRQSPFSILKQLRRSKDESPHED